MQIIEQFAHGKIADNSYTEDRMVIGENSVAVIDGSRGPDHKDPAMIQDALDRATEIAGAITADTTPRTLFDQLTESLAQTKARHGLDGLRYTGGYHVVCYSAHHRQIWRVGDCLARFDGTTHRNDLALEDIGARQRAVMIHAMMMRGTSREEIMQSEAYATMFEPFFAPLLDFANRADHAFGFGVVNGLDIPDAFVEIMTVPEDTPEIILTSDGYPAPADSLADSEAALMALLRTDPLCINENITSKGMMPGQVSFDDRTFVRFALAPVKANSA